MPKPRNKNIETVRPSRDGHEFHEAWAARKALGLVLHRDDLFAIAVEGLYIGDQQIAPAEASDIADLVFFYGNAAGFKNAKSSEIVQVKYSIRKAAQPFKASDAIKTLKKFGITFRKLKNFLGKKALLEKLKFALVTNRPIADSFQKAVFDLAAGKRLSGGEAKQAKQFQSSSGLKGEDLKEFAARFGLIGSTGNLRENKIAAARLITDWSTGHDAISRLRIGKLRELVRDKAGESGKVDNLIRQIDVIGALELQSEQDLLPFPPRFPEVGPIVPREQLAECITLIPDLDLPLLIHAEGGIGKTVFLESLASSLNKEHLCVSFDCFGGGVYRAPEDGRHRPARGLTQIVNTLACSGLCDPFLPTNDNREALISTFRARVIQAAESLQRIKKGKKLIILIDAIDNAAKQAEDKNEDGFPRLILESLEIKGQIKNVKFIVSCRTHRRKLAKGHVKCCERELSPFSLDEARKFLETRVSKLKEFEVNVARAKSLGNPRILAYLARDRNLLDSSGPTDPIKLNSLIAERINSALSEATRNGYPEDEIKSFVAGLSVLPPPVPVQEYADAHGIDVGAVQSFAVDLAPLLERTKYGLTFRDEPTETYIRENHGADKSVLRKLAGNLLQRQDSSVYAANALPALLEILDDGQMLFDLAFNDKIPSSIKSEVGKQKIRYSRIRAAVLHAARSRNYDFLVRLLVELSTVASIHQRGTDYLVDNPELVVLSQDADATRRLIEDHTHWPGTKHARAAIALCLSQDADEGLRHAIRANDWFQFSYNQRDEHHREIDKPSKMDIAAVPFCLIAQNRAKQAVEWLSRYYNSYGFEVCEELCRLLRIANKIRAFPSSNTDAFLKALKRKVGLIAGALSFLEGDQKSQVSLIKKLAVACTSATTEEKFSRDFTGRLTYKLDDGLMKSAALALFNGLKDDAAKIAKVIPPSSSNVFAFFDRWRTYDVSPFIAIAVLQSVANGQPVSYHTALPSELVRAGQQVPAGLSFSDFCTQLKDAYTALCAADAKLPKDQRGRAYYNKDEALRYISERLELVYKFANSFSAIFVADAAKRSKALEDFIEFWEKARNSAGRYNGPEEPHVFFDHVGRQLLEFAVWSGGDWPKATVKSLVEKVYGSNGITETALVQLVDALSRRSDLHELAGELATKTKARIELEDDISSRTTLFGQLAKAMIDASLDEAKEYFRVGLKQMEAIGSGDYEFTNEILGFAGSLKGKELNPPEFHTLSNLFELNMITDTEKLAWYDLARGLVRVSGCRGLAKLARWHDRNKATFEYSLLSYLYALIDQEKLNPILALGLLRLTNAAELYQCNSLHFAKLLERKKPSNLGLLLKEFILQVEVNNPGYGLVGTFEELSSISARVFGEDAAITEHLKIRGVRSRKVIYEQNDRTNYHSPKSTNGKFEKEQEKKKEQDALRMTRLVSKTAPCDKEAISHGLDELGDPLRAFDLKKEFLKRLQDKVSFADRGRFIRTVAQIPNAEFYVKLDILKSCKTAWMPSSQSLKSEFQHVGSTLIEIHSSDLIHNDYFSGAHFREVAELCEWDFRDLTLELIKAFATPESEIPPQIWLEMASMLSDRAKDGVGLLALERLLKSGAAKLSESVADGPYQKNLYPAENGIDIAGCLTWFALGSPSATDRWHAAHALRTFGRLNRWDVFDSVAKCYAGVGAGPFQAPELTFYIFHARLWLLITLARLAIDYPKQIAKYGALLKKVALGKKEPHILLKHFAAQTILTCHQAKALKLSTRDVKALKRADKSKFAPVKLKEFRHSGFDWQRPASHPEPENLFHLDYDFGRGEVESVARVFDVPKWEVIDGISRWVRLHDPNVKAMHDDGGRKTDYRDASQGFNSKRQPYGSQLGWHGLYVVTGKLLASKPTAIEPYDDENPWPGWLKRRVLTRPDGLWLSDGVDPKPIETHLNLFGKSPNEPVTTDEHKILSLLFLDNDQEEEIVLSGRWSSPDGISVRISSCFVVPDKASEVALEVAKANGFNAWLPEIDDHGSPGDGQGGKRKRTFPFLFHPSTLAGIDEGDPLGTIATMRRTQFSKEINSQMGLKTAEPFKRHWIRGKNQIVCRSEAWGSNARDRDEQTESGNRFCCNKKFVSELLERNKMDLLMLVLLRKYDQGYSGKASEYWHTSAIIHLKSDMKKVYYAGLSSAKHVHKW